MAMLLKKVRFLLLIPLLMCFQCNEDDGLAEDELLDTGLLGRWEIADESIDGISDLLPKCCLFFEFFPDGNPQDLAGEFTYSDDFGSYNGIFEIDPENATMRLQREGRDPVLYQYTLNGNQDYLQFTFVEDGSQFLQGWRRVE